MKTGDRVDRLQESLPRTAVVIAVQGANLLLQYEEGGQGWWPSDAVTSVPGGDWGTFKSLLLNHPDLGVTMLAALPSVPQAVLSLPTVLFKCEQGFYEEFSEFAACWQAVVAAAQPSAQVIAQLVSAAEACKLPAGFIAAVAIP